jgi:hypothetical protein
MTANSNLLNSTRKVEKMKQVVNAKNFIQTLDSLRGQVKGALGGYREQVYRLMAQAWLVVLLLRKDKKLQRKFISRAKLKVAAKGKTAFKVVTEVMAYVMDAKTASKRQIAWKRGRVIEFLHNQGVKIAKIAAEIKSRGGIEAVYNQAVKLKPRRDKGSAGEKASGKKAKAPVAKTSGKQDRDESDDADAGSPGTSRRNDGQVIIPLLINLSDRDMLAQLPAGSRVKIIATRISQKTAKIEVVRIKKLKVDASNLKDDDG